MTLAKTYLSRHAMTRFLYIFLYPIDGLTRAERCIINRNFEPIASSSIYSFANDSWVMTKN